MLKASSAVHFCSLFFTVLAFTACGKISVRGNIVRATSTSSISTPLPVLALTATSSFGTRTTSTTSSANTLSLTNSGTVSATACSATLGGANAADFSIFSNACGATVASGASCAITIKATPSAVGVRTATLTFACAEASTATTSNGITVTGALALTFTSASASINLVKAFVNPNSTYTGTSNEVRNLHAASLYHLSSDNSAQVLLSGGQISGSTIISSTVVYTPSTNTYTAGHALLSTRIAHTSSTIRVGGDLHQAVLIVGGISSWGTATTPVSSAEIYDPTGGVGSTPTVRLAASPHYPLMYGAAIPLSSGKVFFVGGSNDFYDNNGNRKATAEIYDPVLDSWTIASSIPTARSGHAAVLVKIGSDSHDGVLVIGGVDNSGNAISAAYLYDVNTDTWASAGSGPAFGALSAVVLADGSVITTGGTDQSYTKSTATYRYVPSLVDGVTSTTWTARHVSIDGRYLHASIALGSGEVLIGGGYTGGGIDYGGEIYNPTTNTWAAMASNLTIGRNNFTTTLLDDGRVLFYGAEQPSTQSQIARVFQRYASTQASPTSGTAPYTYALTTGSGTLYSDGTYIPNQSSNETATITVTDANGITGVYTVTTNP